jgi:hypothetical protein
MQEPEGPAAETQAGAERPRSFAKRVVDPVNTVTWSLRDARWMCKLAWPAYAFSRRGAGGCAGGVDATDVDEDTGESDLVFLGHPVRKLSLPLHVLEKACHTETPEGKKEGTTCATCRYCWTD